MRDNLLMQQLRFYIERFQEVCNFFRGRNSASWKGGGEEMACLTLASGIFQVDFVASGVPVWFRVW